MEFTSEGISEMYKNKCFLKCNFLMEWKGLQVYIYVLFFFKSNVFTTFYWSDIIMFAKQ